MRAERVVPLFVAVAVKQSKHYAYLKKQQQFTHPGPKAFSFPQYFWVRRLGSQGQVVYIPVKTPFCMTRFTS